MTSPDVIFSRRQTNDASLGAGPGDALSGKHPERWRMSVAQEGAVMERNEGGRNKFVTFRGGGWAKNCVPWERRDEFIPGQCALGGGDAPRFLGQKSALSARQARHEGREAHLMAAPPPSAARLRAARLVELAAPSTSHSNKPSLTSRLPLLLKSPRSAIVGAERAVIGVGRAAPWARIRFSANALKPQRAVSDGRVKHSVNGRITKVYTTRGVRAPDVQVDSGMKRC